MRRWIVVIALVWMMMGCVEHSYAITASAAKDELLRRLAQTQQGDTIRLHILYQLTRTAENSQVEAYYINKLVKEAEAQNNTKWRADGYLAHMYLAYNTFQPEEVYKWMKVLEPIARKEKYYDLLFLGKRCVADMLNVGGETEKAEKEAKKVLAEARRLNNCVGIGAAVNSLSNVYQMTYRPEEAIRVLEDNYSTLLKAGNSLSLEASNSLISIYQSKNDRKNWLKWLRLQDMDIGQLIKKSPGQEAQMGVWKLMNSLLYLNYYTTIKDWGKAKRYLDLSEEYSLEGYNAVGGYYHPIRCDYFLETEQYDKALQEVDALIEINRKTSPWVYNQNYFLKASILQRTGRADEALSIYRKAFVIKDSLQVEHIKMQVTQLKSDYKADTLQLERERIDRNMQLVLLLFVVIALLTLVYYITNAYRVRKSLQKSEQDMRRMSDEMELANAAKEHFLSSISSVISGPLNETVKEAMLLATENDLTVEEKQKIAEELNSTSAKLMRLINNILDLSRLEAGMMKFQKTEVDMVALTQNIIDSANMHEAGKVFAVLPKETFMMEIDANRYSQVINSLLEKAEALKADEQIMFTMDITDKGRLFMTFKGAALANRQHDQFQIVVNEVNRMIIEYFGGSYEIHSQESDPSVCITL